MIKPIYHERINDDLELEKKRIENILTNFANSQNQVVQKISWLPLKKVLIELKKMTGMLS